MKIRRILSYIAVAAAASALTMFIAVPQQTDLGIRKLQALENCIEAKFVEEYDETAMYDAAASAMIDSLGNRWSYYIPASEYSAYVEQMNNTYVGIGVTIVVREDGYIDIQKVEPGSPAQEAGIQPGDILIGVEGKDASTMTTDQVKGMVRGEKGTAVQLKLRRGEEILELSVLRKEIQTVVASGTMLEGDFPTYPHFTRAQMEALVKAVQDKGGMYYGLTDQTNFVKEFKDWYLAEGRQVGDYGLVKTSYGYHIMYYSGTEPIWYYYCREMIRDEEANKLVTAAVEKYTPSIDYEKILIGEVKLTTEAEKK